LLLKKKEAEEKPKRASERGRVREGDGTRGR